jgi:hypothetical protein
MRGVDRTRGLKFDHPGLDTSVIRSGSRLIIQNDIGATDAHVIMIAVEVLTTTVTYTDIHHARAKFFMAQLDRFAVDWSGLDQKTAKGLRMTPSFSSPAAIKPTRKSAVTLFSKRSACRSYS